MVNAFRTELMMQPSAWPIEHSHEIFTTGSCFADNLGLWLQQNKFDCTVNPFGTTYNPLSIHRLLTLSVSGEAVDPGLIVSSGDRYFHFDFHSSVCGASEVELTENTSTLLKTGASKLGSARVLVITYGTALVYTWLQRQHVVANCHKVAQGQFARRLLTADEMVQSFDQMYRVLKRINPDLKVLLTVSPVRHIRDTLPLNQVSKSVLRLACHQLEEKHEDVEYFPAYELLLDDLRDYRFYTSDMIHPNEVAIAYIAQKFSDRFFPTHTKTLVQQWQELHKALQHRPFHAGTIEHIRLLHSTLQRLRQMQDKLNVAEEMRAVELQLVTLKG